MKTHILFILTTLFLASCASHHHDGKGRDVAAHDKQQEEYTHNHVEWGSNRR